MPTRNRKESRYYKKYRKILEPGTCQFCDLTAEHEQVVESTTFFWIAENIFPYSTWDDQRVAKHLLLIPKKHTETLSDLTTEEASEFVEMLGTYEAQGYNVYARAPQSEIKTVPHQHTHLIKPKGKRLKAMVYVKKPYVRLVR